VTIDLERAAEALRRGRLDEAEVHAWNALVTGGPDGVAELRRIVAALGSASLQLEIDKRWGPADPAAPPVPVARKGRRVLLLFPLAVIVMTAGAAVWNIPTESSPPPVTDEAFKETRNVVPVILGDGIWLVPLGKVETVDLKRLASELSLAYRAWSAPVPVLPLPRSTRFEGREQLKAEALVNLLNDRFRASGRTTVIGITDYDISDWDSGSSYALRAQVHNGVISTALLGANLGARLQGHSRYERVRKLAKRQVEFHRNGGVQSSDPHSLLRPPVANVGEIDQLDEGL